MSLTGTILRIDLTEGTVEKEPTAPYVKDYIGGIGVSAKIFWDEVPPETRAFDPENLLMFDTGPLTGTPLGARGEFSSKSPELANHPYVHIGLGGQFASEVKFAGYDNIAIKGKADKRSYIFINNDSVEIRDAAHLWGLDVHETQRKIKEELGDPDVQVACIGQAGENLVVYAMIVHDIGNTAAKHGLGAVMGSKNIKAIAVRGTKGVKSADPKKFMELFDKFYDLLTKGKAKVMVKMLHTEGISRQIAEGYKYAYGEEPGDVKLPSPMLDFLKQYSPAPYGCAFCPIQCQQIYSVPGIGNGTTTCVNYFGLLYEKLYDAHDFKLWWERSMLANRYGIEALSVDMLGGWLIELSKKGMITLEDTDGIPMEKGSHETVRALTEKLSKREGRIGELLADGIAHAAEKIGQGSIMFADQYNNCYPYGAVEYEPDIGPEVAKYRTIEVERIPGFADGLGNIPAYADILGISLKEAKEYIDNLASDASEKVTGDRNFWKTSKYSKAIALMAVVGENENLVTDAIGHCEVQSSFLEHYGMDVYIKDYAEWLTADTGIEYTEHEVHTVANRLRMFIDAYNVMCARMLGEKIAVGKPLEMLPKFPVPQRPTDPIDMKRVQDDYCEMRGYDPKTGIPTREALEKIGLKFVADRLHGPDGSCTPEKPVKDRKTKAPREQAAESI